VGFDADIAVWDPEREVTISTEMLHDNVGYTPYEGHKVVGWPETVISRGRIVVEAGELQVERGSGEFLRCDKPTMAKPRGVISPQLDPAKSFGASLI
ncbi:MAG: dihydropyrimidinase, partial [Gammaproteobacteria bacterium]|nr:dihydropyrimidinase [Gammaproteobacteria bacterium]